MKILKNKRIFLGSGLFVLLTILVVSNLFATPVVAQEDDLSYTVLAPLPGTTLKENCVAGDPECKTTLEKYLPGVFKLAIGLAAAAAVLMIVFGGIQYMTTDAIQGKTAGKERVKNAVWGLVLVICAALILSTINPKLLEINLSIDKVSTTQVESGEKGTLLPNMQVAYDSLVEECKGCLITITSTTGGTHSINSAHYQGLAVDIAPNAKLTEYLTGSSNRPSDCARITKTLGGNTATFLWESKGAKCGGTVPSSGDHWHMSIPK